MGFKTERNTGILIKKAARLFEQAANINLEQLGVTYCQTTYLVRLWERDGQSQVELARNAAIAQPSVVRTLDRMERDGLIRRERNQEDRRVFNFYLTEKAKVICQKLEGEANTMHQISTLRFAEPEVRQFNKTLLSIIKNLQDFLADK
jgi:MarR family transcriptional regulator for hemolysin